MSHKERIDSLSKDQTRPVWTRRKTQCLTETAEKAARGMAKVGPSATQMLNRNESFYWAIADITAFTAGRVLFQRPDTQYLLLPARHCTATNPVNISKLPHEAWLQYTHNAVSYKHSSEPKQLTNMPW
jgi:hypothetical protein